MRPLHPYSALRRAGVLVALMLLAAPAGCGTSSPADDPADDPVAVGDRLLPPGRERFAAPRLTWAQGRTLHYGQQTFTEVVDRDVTGLLRTPYGFFLKVVSDEDPLHEHDDVAFWDGRTVTEVSPSVSSFEVSADGRYAGWLERDPDGSRGGLAAIRVVDLSTGRVLVSTSEGMGDPTAGADRLAELYANAWPHFAGFDARNRAYWHRAAGDPSDIRHDLADGTQEPGVDDGEGFPRSLLWEGNRGFRALGTAAGDLPGDWDRLDGLVTPDEQVFVDETNGTVSVYRAEAPRRAVRLPTGHRFAWFHGWSDLAAHRIVLLVRDRNERAYDPAGPDPTSGWILTCDVDEVTCGEPVAVEATRSLVFDDGLDDPLW